MKRHYLYEVRNKASGMRYIGVRSCHGDPGSDVGYWGSSKYVRADIQALGIECFEKIILAEYPTRDAALAAEVEIHAALDVDKSEAFYNRAKQKTRKFDTSALTGEKNHFFGRKHSEETKEKLRTANTGKIGYWRDHPMRPETKQKLREANLGKTYSEESREKRRQAMLGRRTGEAHPMFGKRQSDEARAKIGESLRGRPKSESMKAKLRETQATRQCGFSGRGHTEESRRRISESLRARAAARRGAEAGEGQ